MQDAGINARDVDELVVSNALGSGGNPARIIALASGLPERVAGLSLDRQCAGGLDALLLADALIRSGQCDLVIAGGCESYSRRPLRYHTFADGRAPEPYDQARFTPWADRDPDMAEAANRLAERLGISREAQDEWAMRSHALAASAPADEIVEIAGVSKDPFTRKLTDRLCRRAPVICGSVTAANMSVAADGAAFLVMASPEWAAARGLSGLPLLGGCTTGGDPELPGLAPVSAINQTLDRLGLSSGDLGAVEIMEAFAAQAIACMEGAGIDPALVNRSGGSLARGHPVGASGAVLAVQLFHRLRHAEGPGLAAIAAAGGLGTALVIGPPTSVLHNEFAG